MIYEAKCSRFLLSSAFSLGSLHQNGTRIMLKLIVDTYLSWPIKWYGIFCLWLRFEFNWKLRLQHNTYSFIPIVRKCEYLFCEHSTKIYLYTYLYIHILHSHEFPIIAWAFITYLQTWHDKVLSHFSFKSTLILMFQLCTYHISLFVIPAHF